MKWNKCRNMSNELRNIMKYDKSQSGILERFSNELPNYVFRNVGMSKLFMKFSLIV